MNFNILPECYVDTMVMNIIGFSRVNHKFNIGEVAKGMQKDFKNRLAIGIIDNDKSSIPKYFNDFVVIEEFEGAELKHLPDTKHFIFVVSPAMDGWLFNMAENLGIEMKDYGFGSLKKLKQVTKSQKVGENEKLKDLINRLKQKKNSPLKSVLQKINEILDSDGKLVFS